MRRSAALLGCVVAPDPSPELVIAGVLGVAKDSTPHPLPGRIDPHTSQCLEGTDCRSVPAREEGSQHRAGAALESMGFRSGTKEEVPLHDQCTDHFRESAYVCASSGLYSSNHDPAGLLTPLESPRQTPAPDGLRLTPASMRTNRIDYARFAEQPHRHTPASDVTSQPVQPMHSFASGDSSSCATSAVRVPTSPEEDSSAESPEKDSQNLQLPDEECVGTGLPLQPIMENSTTDISNDSQGMGTQSSPRVKRGHTAAIITPASSWGEFSPVHTVGELSQSARTRVLPAHTPGTSLRQTPCLKRSRSVVGDVGTGNAFCMSTGYTVRQPLDTGVAVLPISAAGSVRRAAIVVHEPDGYPTGATDVSCCRPALAPLSPKSSGVGATCVRESSALEIAECPGSACGLHEELTLALPPGEGLLEQDNVVRGVHTTEPQNAVNLASPFLEDGEASVCNRAFVPSGASATSRSAGLGSRNEVPEVRQDMRQDWLGSTHAVCIQPQASNLGKTACSPQRSVHTDAAVIGQRSMSAELVPWSPQKHYRHSHTPHADHGYTSALVPSSQHSSAAHSHMRARSPSAVPGRRLNEVQVHTVHAQRPSSVAVQCGPGSFRNDCRSAVLHPEDLDDVVTSAMPRRQLQVVQQFVAESVVPTLAQCALTPAEHALGPLATQAMGMLDDAARAGVEPCMRFLQAAVARLEDTAARTHELNAQLSATRAELRAAEFELKVVRAESTAMMRELKACERENECFRKEGEKAQERLARNKDLEDELADASSAREVLALALARLLRDTKHQKLDAHLITGSDPVAALETQLNSLSVRDSNTSAPRQNNNFIASSLAVAHKILGTDTFDPAAVQSTSPVFMNLQNAQSEYRGNMPDHSECLGSQVLRFRAPSERARSPQSPMSHNSALLPAYQDEQQSVPTSQSMERVLMTASTDIVRQESPVCGQSPVHQEKSAIRTDSPMSNPMRTPSSMGESAVGVGNALPGLSPIHAQPVSSPQTSPAEKGVSPLVLNMGKLAVDDPLQMVPTRARTPDCFLDRMKGAASDVDDEITAPGAHTQGQDVQLQGEHANECNQLSLVPHFHNRADAPLSASLAAPDMQQPQHSGVEPPCLAQSPDIPAEGNDDCKLDRQGTGSGGRRLHIPADISGSKDDSDHDSSRAWHRSLGMSYVKDTHTAPFSVLPHRPAASLDRPALARSQEFNGSHAEKELIDLHATAAAPMIDVRESSRSPPVLASNNSLIDADVPPTAALEHALGTENGSNHAVEEGQAPGVYPPEGPVAQRETQVGFEQGKAANAPVRLHGSQDQYSLQEPSGHRPQLASPQRPASKPGVYPDVAASPGVDPVGAGPLPSAQAQAAAQEVRRFCAMAEKQAEVSPEMVQDRMQGLHRSKPLVVPVAPDLRTARRAYRAGRMTASQEKARASMGRKRATVLAGHFGGSYAAKSKVLAQGHGGMGVGSYAALAARARQRRA